jgi:hypothetical protein
MAASPDFKSHIIRVNTQSGRRYLAQVARTRYALGVEASSSPIKENIATHRAVIVTSMGR